MTTPSSTIAIIGAGVFGLTTALHLAQRGYKHVTVYDYQPYHLNAYNPAEGCDAASADVNKIYRCSYGKETEYQDLAFSGRPIWLSWNALLSSTPPHLLPPGLSPSDTLFTEEEDMKRLEELDKQDPSPNWIRKTQALSPLTSPQPPPLTPSSTTSTPSTTAPSPASSPTTAPPTPSTTSPAHPTAPPSKPHAPTPAHPAIPTTPRPYPLATTLDTSAGFTYADKSCAFARFLAEQAGVRFVLGPEEGKFDELLFDEGKGEGEGGEKKGEKERKVRGLKTVDGKEHLADVVIVACGGWTPSIIPEVEGLLETTAGSVVTVQLPKDRQDLWDKYAPENFPVWAYGLTGHESPEYGGFYGFPRTAEGKIKIGYRGRKWTNYQVNPKTGKELSTPLTAYTPTPATSLPLPALALIKHIIALALPDLAHPSIGISATRMCWYTDSVDNSFVVDYVPGWGGGLFVASGGSGHGFKFLPVLGKHIVNALEKKPDQFTKMFAWRTAAPDDKYANGLREDKETSGRDLGSMKMGEKVDWLF
ncbi:hypothetical protein B9479_008007 [Cryptococcus floricola]|uniref:FAD dependent oxidoreductase domain-containing protein n=1 Tax=Cryptococcus floricola TaxID=2591691 RepID=A0A5D3AN32_9TREE|nr:hypothetical protein B9479_008007 [Cryptococcus floricola]